MSWDSISTALRDFLYNQTELAIWLGLALLALSLFWLMVYSISVRRNMTILIILAAIAVWAAFEYGFLEWPAAVPPG